MQLGGGGGGVFKILVKKPFGEGDGFSHLNRGYRFKSSLQLSVIFPGKCVITRMV
jgi:hypothetical protein